MRRALLTAKVAITAALLAGVLAAVDLRALRGLLGDASLGYLAAATAAVIVQTLVLAVRFNAIVAALGRPLAVQEAVEISFIGVLFNQALPSRRAAAPRDERSAGRDAIRAAPRVLLSTSALSAASHLLAALAAYWLGTALGVELDIGTFFAIALTMVLAMMVPLSYAVWGIREAGALWLFTRAGVGAESALAVSVLYGAVLLVAALPGVPLWLAPSWAQGTTRRPSPAPVPSPNGRP